LSAPSERLAEFSETLAALLYPFRPTPDYPCPRKFPVNADLSESYCEKGTVSICAEIEQRGGALRLAMTDFAARCASEIF
jgi:hypothetical protein